jgi:predicted DNA-binding antitoxin AbrB/MazE fold protein
MEKKVVVVFDGKVFVPTEPVELQEGEKAEVTYWVYTQPPPPTPEQQAKWEELQRHWATVDWPRETVEEALGRPKYEP